MVCLSKEIPDIQDGLIIKINSYIGPTRELMTNYPGIGFIMLSLFCAGGLFAYIREVLRLRRLMAEGKLVQATVLNKEKIEGGETVVHYLVTYQFIDDLGETRVHEQDLNSSIYFDSLNVEDEIKILYQEGSTKNSYPLSQVRTDLNISYGISLILVLVWMVMGAIVY